MASDERKDGDALKMYTVVMGILVINTALILTGNILSDVLYVVFDPRIRFK